MTLRILTLALLAAVLAGCQTTESTGRAKPKGFLGDYSMLKPGKEGQAQLVYVDPAVDFSSYRKVLVDPVSFWFSHDSKLDKVSAEDRQMLAHHLGQAVSRKLIQDYEFVGKPGPGVLRLRFAITEAVGAGVVGDVVSTVLPIGRIISEGKKLVTGTQSFVGKAAVELEVVDSVTGKRLAAAIDERAGGKTLQGLGSTWDDVKEAFDYWAERLAIRLGDLRAGKN